MTHSDPVDRARSNYIQRLAIEDQPGQSEQVWTHTSDNQTFELCCIPFFPYGISLGDRLAIRDDGSFKVLEKSGHQTIRVMILDEAYAHERHTDFHDLIAQTGARSEIRGHASSYWAIDVDDATHAQRVIDVLTPLWVTRTIDWEWADPPLQT